MRVLEVEATGLDRPSLTSFSSSFTLLLVTLGVFSGCGEYAIEPATAASVEVTPAEAAADVDATFPFSATVRDDRGKELRGVGVAWSVEDVGLAAVTSEGVLWGRAPGETRVTASVDGVRGHALVTITAPVPAAPSGLRTATGPDGVWISWSDGSRFETRFEIERGEAPGGAFDAVGAVEADTYEYLDEEAAYDAQYRYRVRSCNDSGCSPYSLEKQVGTLPAPPTELRAVDAGPTRAELSWSDNSTTETAFIVERRTDAGSYVEVTRLPSDSSRFENTGLNPDTRYFFRIQACSGVGCSDPSPEAGVTTAALTAPSPPADLVSWRVGPTQIVLSWMDTSGDETSFRVERALGTEAFSLLVKLGPGVTAHSDVELDRDTRVRYRVQACNAAGCSGHSNETSRVTPPNAPTGAAATAAGETAVLLTWTDGNVTETGHRVERRQGDQGYTEIGLLEADVESFADTGLLRDTDYTYRVRACNESGCSDFSAETSVVTPVTSPPTPPAQLFAVMGDQARVFLTWQDNSSIETSFEIERQDPGGAFTLLIELDPDRDSHIDTAVELETEYGYRVRACGTAGCSAYSNEVYPTTPPYAPDGLVATPTSSTTIELTWNDNSEAETKYQLEGSTASGSFVPHAVFQLPPNTTTFTAGGLNPNVTYRYRVRACILGLCSAPSTEAMATLANGL